MKELEYPFDASWILSNRRKIRNQLLASEMNWIEKKIAILGGSTTSNITQVLDLFLLNQGIKAVFYQSEYGKYYEDIMFKNEELEVFKPDIIYIHTSNRNIMKYPELCESADEIEKMIDEQVGKFITLWDKIRDTYACPIVQNNFEMPRYRLLGNKDISDVHGSVNFLSRINMAFNKYAQEHTDFFLCDINYISADYGLKEWSDSFYWHMYKCALNVNAIPLLAFNVANIMKSIFGKNKKGFVLDLDNTLWGGVIGDEGVDNIKIGPETAEGQVYLEFQSYIKAHKQMGIVLSIDSKNDEKNALLGLNHPDSILKPEDFIEIRANWESKDRNFLEIANDLNLLPDSLVFVDDNPAERHIVSGQIRGVSTPQIGDPHQYIVNIDRNGFFEMTYLSEDDLKRNHMYQENIKRAKAQLTFSDYGEYLDSLEMKAVIKPFEDIYISRIAQLTNKSNQFNLTTKRYTQGELETITNDTHYLTLYGKLEDKFGDNGVVALCIGHLVGKMCYIDLFLMSCRVLKRDMEYAMMDELIRRCKSKGISELRGYYYPTSKNKMVKEFYGELGFKKISENSEGSEWSLLIETPYTDKNKHIKVEVEE
ncbi:HAD family hydrolase [Solobacterium sp.]|jgi:fkbH domain|uniref:HAD-IIIC family phosphatase n=1 Tax=Solobacterium sp. TaxID=2060878 RepID=UPI001CB3F6A2|nr:HAD-IIIC family phosphatase [Solobacterium sp.]MBF1100213.1 HAD-IIIC family phosphatase [Solobacterium sp.]